MSDSFRPANRQSAKPLIGVFSESGCGKTFGSLLLGRGFVGKGGRIGMIETESGRGEAYADPKEYPELAGPGAANYDVLSLRDDFSPSAYGAALKAAEAAKFDALIIDSASHEWSGPGGVLAMAAANQEAGLKGVLVWQKPKIAHSRQFMLPVLQTPIPLVILCMRAKYPMEQPKGSSEWKRSSKLEPIQSEDILFEMFVHGWIDQEHKFHLTKSSSKALIPVFPEGQPITLETGRALAAWARGDNVEHKKTSQEILQEVKDELLEAAEGGMAPLSGLWGRLEERQRKYLAAYYSEILVPTAEKADAGQDPNA